jgi:beta-mannosidase
VETHRIILKSGWRFRELNPRGGSEASDLDWMPAQVPGNVHLDLVRNGVIADPFQRVYERSCAWVDETDWIYETTFPLEEPPAHAYLLFHGLDTCTEIFLNGEELGRTDNMFIPHEFPVGGKLHPSENTLRILFRSALRVGRERQQAWRGADSLPRPHGFVWGPRSFVRKAQYMFGWDWGPELASCGIWQPAELVTVPVARLLDWKHIAEFIGGTLASPEKAVVHVEAEVERAPGQEDRPLTFTAGFTGLANLTAVYADPLPPPATTAVPTGNRRAVVRCILVVENPRLWWPNGMHLENDRYPPLYTLALSLHCASEGSEQKVDEKRSYIGLRTVELLREPDTDGSGESFRFRVNGQGIFIKGANWIPPDSFPGRLYHEPEGINRPSLPKCHCPTQYLLQRAHEAHVNMLRVWGGGMYESEHFYELCDAYGILAWQDFPYACAYYPDTGEYAEAARKEALAAVRRLRNHPSLALWCGNNENHMMFYHHWEGKETKAPRLLGEKLYHQILPAVVAQEDPKTPYWPSSPYGGEDPNSANFGDRHNWDVWHGRGDWIYYTQDNSRFVSEFGFASSCGLQAWERCLAKGDKWPGSPVVRWHNKTCKGYDTYLNYIQLHFPLPRTLEDLVYYSQLNQAEALKCGVEHWRRQKGRCWGTLFWQWNDCWPVQSWSVIDYAQYPKAAYYFAKRFYAPVLLSLIRRGEEVEAHLTNDLPEPIQGEVTLNVETFDGDVLISETWNAYILENDTEPIGTIHVAPVLLHAREVYLYARFEPYGPIGQGPVENFLFLAKPKDLRLSDPSLTAHITQFDDRSDLWEITITAERFAPYVWWRDDATRPEERGQIQGSDNFMHLRAGESRRVQLQGVEDFPRGESLQERIVIRSL